MRRGLGGSIKMCGSFLKYAVLAFAFVFFFVFDDQNQKQYFSNDKANL